MLYESQKLALGYFAVAIVLFGLQLLTGLVAAYQFLDPTFLSGPFPFSVWRTLHLNTMVVWLLMGFIGGIYWFLPLETGREVVGIRWGKIAFAILVVAILIVAAVFLFKQIGRGDFWSIWFINEGREYIEAPRWADFGIVAVMGVISFNLLATALKAERISGLLGVLLFDLIALVGLYLAGMFWTPNLTHDQFWWWWVVHLWVEATWEILVGVLMGWSLISLLGSPRWLVEGWLYLEVLLVVATGVLGLGHHYFWIGTPEYWLGIGGFFSALEPLPLVAMVVHAVYDAGAHRLESANRPALFWLLLQAFGNFLGAGVWGFMQTLPQINLYSHGTQLAASHGHLAFFGAYVSTNLVLIYLALQRWKEQTATVPLHRSGEPKGVCGFESPFWHLVYIAMIVAMLGMAGSLLVAGFTQTFLERAVGGATWQDYMAVQEHPWMVNAFRWRLGFGLLFFLAYLLLIYDLFTLFRRDRKNAVLRTATDL